MTNLNKLELKDLILRYQSELKKLETQLEITKKTIHDLKKQESTAQPMISAKRAESTAPAAPKRRGRPKKNPEAATTPAAPKRRGRPRKNPEAATTPAAPKRRGRPRKNPEAATTPAAPKRRGRPRKNPEAATTPAAPKRRGRPRKNPEAASKPKVDGRKNRTVIGGYKLSEWDQFIIDTLNEKQTVLINQQILDFAKEKVQKENLDMNDIQLRGKLNRSLHKLANRRDDLIKVDFPGKGYAYGLPSWKSGPNQVKKKYRSN